MAVQRQGLALFFFTSNSGSDAHCNAFQHFVSSFMEPNDADGTMKWNRPIAYTLQNDYNILYKI